MAAPRRPTLGVETGTRRSDDKGSAWRKSMWRCLVRLLSPSPLSFARTDSHDSEVQLIAENPGPMLSALGDVFIETFRPVCRFCEQFGTRSGQ